MLIILFYFNSLLTEWCCCCSFSWHQSQNDEQVFLEPLFLPLLHLWPPVTFTCNLGTAQGCGTQGTAASSRAAYPASHKFHRKSSEMRIFGLKQGREHHLFYLSAWDLRETCAVCFPGIIVAVKMLQVTSVPPISFQTTSLSILGDKNPAG